MHAVGSPVRRRLVICYTISAAVASVAGGLWAQTNAYVNLSVLSLDRAATVLIVLILGGYFTAPSSVPWSIWHSSISSRASTRPHDSSVSACCSC
jgi:branched-chain amino acid transport system permease protein